MAVGLFACEKELDQMEKVDSIVYNPTTTGGKIFATVHQLSTGNDGVLVLNDDGSVNDDYPLITTAMNSGCSSLPRVFSINNGIGVTGEGVLFLTEGRFIHASIVKAKVDGEVIGEFIAPIYTTIDSVQGPNLFRMVAMKNNAVQGFEFTDVEAITFPLNASDPTGPMNPSEPIVTIQESLEGASEYFLGVSQVFAVGNDNWLYYTAFQNSYNFGDCTPFDMRPVFNLGQLNINGSFKLALTKEYLYVYEVHSGKIYQFYYHSRGGYVTLNSNYHNNGFGNVGQPDLLTFLGCSSNPVVNSAFCLMGETNGLNGISGIRPFLFYKLDGPCRTQLGKEIIGGVSSFNRDHKSPGNSNSIVIDSDIITIYDVSAANFASFDTFKIQ